MSSREAPKRKELCDFCGRDRAEVNLLFRADRGGVGSMICGGCVLEFAAVVKTNTETIGFDK